MRWVDGKLAVLWVGPIALLSGCGDDQSNNPPAQNDISPEIAVEASLAAAEFIDVFVSSIGDVMAGDLTGGSEAVRPPGGLSRDDVCLHQEPACSHHWTGTAWTASCTSTSMDCSISTWVFVQYLDGAGQPQMVPDASTQEATHRVDKTVDFLGEDTPGRAADVVDYYSDFNSDMSIRDLQEEVYSARGSGSMELAISGEEDGIAFAEAVGASWASDLAVPANGGCASGSVRITVGRYTTIVVYGSDGRYTVTVDLDGHEIHRDKGISDCA